MRGKGKTVSRVSFYWGENTHWPSSSDVVHGAEPGSPVE